MSAGAQNGFDVSFEEMHAAARKIKLASCDLTEVRLMPRGDEYGSASDLGGAVELWAATWERASAMLREEMVNVAAALGDCAAAYERLEEALGEHWRGGVSILDGFGSCMPEQA